MFQGVGWLDTLAALLRVTRPRLNARGCLGIELLGHGRRPPLGADAQHGQRAYHRPLPNHDRVTRFDLARGFGNQGVDLDAALVDFIARE